MGWNGTYIDGINTKMSGSATGSIQQALGSSPTSQITLFNLEKSKDDRWAKYRPVVSALDKAGNQIVTIHARNGGTINAYGGTGTTPGYIGNMRDHSVTIDGVSRTFVTFCGLDVPLIAPTSSNPDTQKAMIFELAGTTNFNWRKTVCALPSEDGRFKRALDFDGYKPSAGFPIEYMENGREIDPLTSVMDVGARYAETNDDYRVFPGDLGKYYFNDALVWAAVLRRKASGGSTWYYSDILYQDENGHSFKMSDYVSEYSPYRGWVSIRVPNSYYFNHRGDTLQICMIGYVPSTGYAILLPSDGGVGTTNPVTWTIASSTINDPLLKLTFDISAGKWGRSSTVPGSLANMIAFPQGIPGATLQSSKGLYASGTASSLFFSVTFTNPTSSAITIPTGKLVFDVSRFNPVTWAADQTTRQNPVYYNAPGGSTITSINVPANGSVTIYVSIGNIWQGITADTTTNYADMMGLKIVHLDYQQSFYQKGSAMFFAKNTGASGWNFNCSWDENENRMKIV